MEITDEHLRTLRHMLGIDCSSRIIEPYRNYYAANPGDKHLKELSTMGLVEFCGNRWGYDYFKTSEKGRGLAIESHIRIVKKVPRGRRTYLAYLSISDCNPDLTFKEFLTNPDYAHARKGVSK